MPQLLCMIFIIHWSLKFLCQPLQDCLCLLEQRKSNASCKKNFGYSDIHVEVDLFLIELLYFRFKSY